MVIPPVMEGPIKLPVEEGQLYLEEVKMKAKMKAQEGKLKYEELMKKAMAESACVGCVHHPICQYCYVVGDVSTFACRGCGLPVPEVLPRCNICGHNTIPFMFCCHDCVHGYSVDASGVCCSCGRNQVNDVNEDKEDGMFVPETEDN